MSRMDGNTVIVTRSTRADKLPIPVLFTQIETGSIGDKDPSDEPTGETKPADDPESGVNVDIVVDDCG